MKFKIGNIVESKFGNGVVQDTKVLKGNNLYKIELIDGSHKGKIPWFAEHELKLEKITYAEEEEKIIYPGFEGEEEYK